jgi:S1-C subfamily serine protease
VGRVDRDSVPEPVVGSVVQNLQGRVAGVAVARGVPAGGDSILLVDVATRNGTITVRGLGERFVPLSTASTSPALLGQRFVAGVGLATITPTLGAYFNVDSGVLVTEVVDQSPGSDAGLMAGDVLIEVAGRPVSGVDDVRRAFSEFRANGANSGEGVPIRVVRTGRSMELAVPGD